MSDKPNDTKAMSDERIAKLKEVARATLQPLLHECLDEIERLRKIVDALPKTDDGVPIVPGMDVWTPPLPSQAEATKMTVPFTSDYISLVESWRERHPAFLRTASLPICLVYSTSEAALAATKRRKVSNE